MGKMIQLAIKTLAIAAVTLMTLQSYSEQEEYFGEFSGQPKLEVKDNESARPTFILLEDFAFTDPNGLTWKTPEGWEVDGATIPRFAWSIVGGPLSGRYLNASVIHDHYCDTEERTAHDTHRNFFYGMRANDVPEKKAAVLYWAVRTFGPSWKVVKKATSSGIVGPPKSWRLVREKVDAPSISDELAQHLIESLDTVDMDKLDELSDAVRSEHESEAIQKNFPTLTSEEMGFDPDILKRLFRF